MKLFMAFACVVAGVSGANAGGFKDESARSAPVPSGFREIKAPAGLDASGKPGIGDTDRLPPSGSNNKIAIIRPALRADIADFMEKPATETKHAATGKSAQADKAPIPGDWAAGVPTSDKSASSGAGVTSKR